MRTLLVLLLSTLSCLAQIPITNGLICDLDARYGVLTSNGASFNYVTNWTDNHTNTLSDSIWNNATNLDYNSTFISQLDYYGQPVVQSPHGLNSDSGFRMVIPTNGFVANLSNFTVYAVCTPCLQHNAGNLFEWTTGFAFKLMHFSEVPSVPAYQYPMGWLPQSRQTTNLWFPVNKSVVVMSSTTGALYSGINHYVETNQPYTSTGVMGVELGGKSLTIYWGGFLYRILIFNQGHNVSQIHSNVDYLVQTHAVVTNFTRLAVCRGDSITEGYFCTNQQSWPFQLWQRNPDVLVYNSGVVSAKISTNLVAGSNNVLYSNDWWWVDYLFTNNGYIRSMHLSTNLLVKAGVNDINPAGDNMTGQLTEQRLTNYCAARLANIPTLNLYVSTIANCSRSPAENTNFNAAIRADKNGWWKAYADPGCASPRETRLNTYSDQNYFSSDQLHLIFRGAGVVADHFQQFINLPRRQGSFY